MRSLHVNGRLILLAVALAFSSTAPLSGQRQAPAPGGEAAAARHFESIRSSPPELAAFLRMMPKGADLHSHLSGTVYAETYIAWAAAGGLCVQTERLAIVVCETDPGKDPNNVPASNALSDAVLYRRLINSMSMRNAGLSGLSGHDQFFDAFAKFGPATQNTADMLAEAVSRAADGNVSYVEIMLTPPDGGVTGTLGRKVGFSGDFQATFDALQKEGIAQALPAARASIAAIQKRKDELLMCGTPAARPGCAVTVRFIAQVSRGGPPGAVFAQMMTGLALAADPSSHVVGVNLVQAEDGLASMANFAVQMKMLQFLRPKFKGAHLTLHAGELAWGLVPPEGLRSHVRESVLVAGAERIGHGVDIMHEDDPFGLLREMSRRKVLVEICLTSNDAILGVKGRDHPLRTYMKYGVPVALATDDEGVARSEMTREWVKAVLEQGLGYRDLKRMAKASLEHAFIGDAEKRELLRKLEADFARFERDRRYR